MTTEVKRSLNENTLGSSWAALAAEEDPQGREIETLWSKREQEEEETGEGGRGSGDVGQQ